MKGEEREDPLRCPGQADRNAVLTEFEAAQQVELRRGDGGGKEIGPAQCHGSRQRHLGALRMMLQRTDSVSSHWPNWLRTITLSRYRRRHPAVTDVLSASATHSEQELVAREDVVLRSRTRPMSIGDGLAVSHRGYAAPDRVRKSTRSPGSRRPTPTAGDGHPRRLEAVGYQSGITILMAR
jgi:hypothetical protein